MDREKLRQLEIEDSRSLGLAEPINEGFLTEFGQGTAQAFAQAMRGTGSSFREWGLGSGMYDYWNSVLRTNQQWNAHEGYSTLSLNPGNLGRTLGTGLGSTASTLAVGGAATLLGGPWAGAAASGAAVFAQLYGDNLNEFRQQFANLGYSDGEIQAMAAGRTLIDSVVEVVLGIVPAGGRIVGSLTRAARNEVAREAVRAATGKFGKPLVMRVLQGIGRGALEEGSEEVLQYINEYAWRSLGGDKTANFSLKEAAERFAGGALPGGVFGAGEAVINGDSESDKPRSAASDIPRPVDMKQPPWMKHWSPKDNATADLDKLVDAAPKPQQEGDYEFTREDFAMVQPRSSSAKALDAIGKAIGLNVRYFVPTSGAGSVLNGLTTKDGTLYLDASAVAQNPIQSLGHEFIELLHKRYPDLYQYWHDQLSQAVDPQVRVAEEQNLAGIYDNPEDDVTKEFDADRMGELFADPEMWPKAALAFERKSVGWGQRFIRVLTQFIQAIKTHLGKFTGQEDYIENLEKARDAAAEVLSEFKRREAGMLVPAGEVQDSSTLPPFEQVQAFQAQQAQDAQRIQQGMRQDGNLRPPPPPIVPPPAPSAPPPPMAPPSNPRPAPPAPPAPPSTPPTAPQSRPPAPPRPAPPSEPPAAPPPGSGRDTTITTPNGEITTKGRYRVVDLSYLVASDDKRYDQSLQPRNRDTASSKMQIQEIAKDLNPTMLLDSPTSDTGAPVIDEKGQVLSGNGRTAAIRLAAATGKATAYFQAVREWARRNGIEIPDNIKNPVLVREINSAGVNLQDFAEFSNRDNKLARTDSEQADADAETIERDNLLKYLHTEDGSELSGMANREFVTRFIESTGDQSLRNSDGSPTDRALQRIRRAVMASVSRGMESARETVRSLIENSEKYSVVQQVRGVQDVGPALVKLARTKPQYNLLPHLARALRDLLEYKAMLRKNSKRFNSIDDYLSLQELDSKNERSKEAEIILQNIADASSIKQVREFLARFAIPASREVDADDMFGAEPPTLRELLERAAQPEQTGDLFSQPQPQPKSEAKQPESKPKSEPKPEPPKRSLEERLQEEAEKRGLGKAWREKVIFTGPGESTRKLDNSKPRDTVKETPQPKEEGNHGGTSSDTVRNGAPGVPGTVSQSVPAPPAQNEAAPATPAPDRTEGAGGGGAESTPAAGRSPGSRVRNSSVPADGRGRGGVQRSGAGASSQAVEGELPRSGSAQVPVSPGLKANHRIRPEDTLIPGGNVSKIKANIAAIKLLKQLEAERREATPEEKRILAQYVGWGGLPNVFKEGNPYYDQLKALLTPAEFTSARHSTQNAHYTDRQIITRMWHLAERLGFHGGRVGEFGAGIGHFLGLVPDSLAPHTRFRAVELDSITGRMLKKLYPKAKVDVTGLEHVKIPENSLDMVIGNFPFSAVAPFDKNYPKLSLHNYFFARAVDAVKPGGLVISVTSTGTMDSYDTTARNLISEKADLVGAIRLPQDAFMKNAGTSVVTDIIVLRKKDGSNFPGAFWEDIAWMDTGDDTGRIPINAYYKSHQSNLLGILSRTGSQYTSDMPTLLARPDQDTAAELQKVIEKNFPQNIVNLKSTPELEAEEQQESAEPETTHKEGEHFIRDGKIYETVDGKAVERRDTRKGTQAKNLDLVKKLSSLVKAFNTLVEAMKRGDPDSRIAELQKNLKSAFDAFVKKDKTSVYHLDSPTFGFLRNDPNFLRISGLELFSSRLDKEGKVQKDYRLNSIFTQRTIQKLEEPQTAKDINDAGTISLYQKGTLDIPYMAKLLGKSEAETRKEMLTGNAPFYENPATGEIEPAAKYLSGNIVEKLGVAKRAMDEQRPDLQRNIDALERVRPKRKDILHIKFGMQAPWVPQHLIENWAKQFFGINFRFDFNPVTQHWQVDYDSSIDSYRAPSVYNAVGGAAQLLQNTLNLSDMKVFDKVDGHNVLNPAKSSTAREFRTQFENSFRDYVLKNQEASRQIENNYNEKVNHTVISQFDYAESGRFPGMAKEVNGIKDFSLRKHQRRAVARAIQEGRLLFAHCVGAGKTYAMITTAMELRRLGLARKNLIVVQNSTLEQFAKDAAALYPDAKILVAREQDLAKANRKRFASIIASGDWDIVVMAQSSFNLLPVSEEIVQHRVDMLQNELREVSESAGNRLSVKQMEQQFSRLEASVRRMMRTPKDDVLFFDELGFDSLFVDEAHAYKKLKFFTQMQRIRGLDTSGSTIAFGLQLKIDAVREKSGGRNIYFATGTPITNTLAEAWNMVRFLDPSVLTAFNVNHFDEFASIFTETESQPELNAAGKLVVVERFSKFANARELSKFFRSVADIVFKEDLDIKLPRLKGGKPQYVALPRSAGLQKIMNYFLDLYSWYNGLSRQEKIEHSSIPLQIYMMARKATLDMRLIDSSLPDDPGSKVNRVVEDVVKNYHNSQAQKGAQAIFADLYQLSGDDGFNVYHEIKRKLVEAGIPADEIVAISDFDKKKRENVFTQVRSGDVRVIMGSTQTLGTGVNIQDRLVAEYNLDAPMMPSDMEQRIGRIERQGNMIEEPEVVNYAVEQTLDASLYQMLARKSKMIQQVLKGEVDEVEVEDDSSIDYGTFAAELSGNPDALRKVQLDSELKQLVNRKRLFDDELVRTRDTEIPQTQQQITATRESVDALGQAIGQYGEVDFSEGLTLESHGRKIEGKRKEVMESLNSILDAAMKNYGGRIKISLNGVPLELNTLETATGERYLNYYIPGIEVSPTDIGGNIRSGEGLLRSLANTLKELPNAKERYAKQLPLLQSRLEQQKELLKHPDFPAQDKIDELNAENAQLIARIGNQTKEKRVEKEPNLADYIHGGHIEHLEAEIATDEKEVNAAPAEEAEEEGASYSLNRPRPRRQVNPVVTDAKIRAEYQAELGKGYTKESVEQWDEEAIEWIERQGGVENAVEQVLNNTEHSDRHVASLVRRHLMNSTVFARLDPEKRAKLELKHVFSGTEWGREGVARKLASLTLDSYEKVKALFEKIASEMPDKERIKFRNRVMDETGIDIYELPEDITDDARELDRLLRAALSAQATLSDRLYEYWINAILSGPATHVRNVTGNTLNAAYELGAKRAVEAALNLVTRRKTGATFGEFLEIWKHVDWKEAWRRAKLGFDLEVLTPEGKYNEKAGVALGGRKGRLLRIPGRLLRAADEFNKGLFAPLEAASYAYRQGRANGLSGEALRSFIRKEMNDPKSEASRHGEQRALELTFQEDPGTLVQYLVSLKQSNTPVGRIASYLFPFVRTPANLLRQGVRKSPLGAVSFLLSDVPKALKTRQISDQFIAHAAEQLIAWSVLAMLYHNGGDDKDGLPLITGVGAPYGSNERNFKGNKVPPLSIRIGDKYYSYKYLEPLSSGLAIIGNGLEALKAKDAKGVKQALIGMSGFIAEKSYLDSIREAYEFMQDPERSGTRFATNFAASWVPNAYRQTVNAFDDHVRDNRTRAKGLKFFTDQFTIVTNSAGFTRALPKVDYFGREVNKDAFQDSAAGPLSRLLSIQTADPDKTMDAADKLLWNYNRKHPDAAYWPGLPAYYTKTGNQTLYIEGSDFTKFATEAGKLAHREILREIRTGRLNGRNPGEADIARIKTIFTQARKAARNKFRSRFHK